MSPAASSKRILIATIGSLGDLHPCLGLGLELQRRGHRVTIAATEFYRPKIESLGLGFHPMRPNWNPTDPEIIARCEDIKRGLEVLFRELILPALRGTYEDLLSAAMDADMMIAGEMVFAAPLIAEKLNLRWASAILSPCSFLSAHDPPVLPNVPWLIHARKAGWRTYRAVGNLCALALRHWWNPVRELRRELGLREKCDPIRQDKFSPYLVLALFSPLLAQPQPDWPAQTMQPGFVFYDKQTAGAETPPEIVEFLASGDAPIVFTQGSTAVHNAGRFYETSIAAARLLGRRAVLIGAAPELSSPGILALRYTPYSAIFPHAAVIVHQGGSGTIGQALRAGRPMLIVPYGWDQPDNGARVQRMGVGLSLPRSRYTPQTAVAALERLLGEPQYTARAATLGKLVRMEDGLRLASDAIESVLSGIEKHSA
jgi:UDP:flavonoid glycosyltransferase YjiC (YdhE family)